MNLPGTILSEIFSYIPLPQRWLVSSVCRTWNNVCHDPYLYRHLVFENLEYRTLVLCFQKILTISPRVKSIKIKGCYSKFVQNTVVPVQFSNGTNNPVLFSHITALQPPRRRAEYMKLNFELHDQFSDAINQLFGFNKLNLNSLVIEDCTLDLEMTELFCTIACHGHGLERFVYRNNRDKGISSSGLLQAIVTACPRMRDFRGLHSGMDDAVLVTIGRHWSLLRSITLCSLKSRDIRGHAEIISDGRQLIGSSPTGRISSQALWQLLSRCNQLETLELFDLSSVSNRDMINYNNLRTQIPSGKKRFAPYTIPKSTYATPNAKTTVQPGFSIRNLFISKYMTTPLSKPGFESLLELFPKLRRLEYETNFYTFDNLFEGVTREMFHAECIAVQEWCDQRKDQLEYIGHWNAPITSEQRLMAGMASVSEGA
ncbi:hypothetical protein INT47_008390 [Mucor saturninus]|uniref:F-box domain-containing protein n=1 Tax=Mucor saturninus TaxID=64648 RepID=A0A8H7RE77_9FUNG|nr:hypothetical protein INT47_008390 [Mucor saturninus]